MKVRELAHESHRRASQESKIGAGPKLYYLGAWFRLSAMAITTLATATATPAAASVTQPNVAMLAMV